MKKITLLLFSFVLLVGGVFAIDKNSHPNIFSPNTPAKASEVNENFDSLDSKCDQIVDTLNRMRRNTRADTLYVDSAFISGLFFDSASGDTVFSTAIKGTRGIFGNVDINSGDIGPFTLTGKLTGGAQEIEGSAFDIDGGDISSATISGGLTWSAAQNLNNQALTNVDINSGNIGPFTLTGKLTGGAQEIEGSNFDINGGNISSATISGGLTWSAAQNLNNQTLTNVDINSGNIGPFTLTGKLTGGSQEIEGSNFDITGGDISNVDIGSGVNGRVYDAGINWTSRSSAADNNWYSVCYGNGLFVAVAYTGTGNRVMTSPDGTNWTIRSSAADNNWFSVCYGNGLFVAVAYTGSGNRVMTSPDGITWTSRSSAADNGWYGVCYGNGLFVAVANTGTGNRVMTSPDGINWTLRSSAADNVWYGVCYGNGLFVAVAYTGTGNRVMTSPDGITWTSRSSAADNGWYGVCYGNGLFVAVANTGTGNRVMTSPDGITWTSRSSAADNGWYGVCYGNGLFVAVAYTGTGNRVMTSPYGITWTSRSSAADNGWYGVCYGNGLFVTVSNSGTGDRVMTSGYPKNVEVAHNNQYNGEHTFTDSVYVDVLGVGTFASSNFDINGGDISAATISGGLTWSAAQDLNNQALTNVDINSGNIGPFTLTGKLTGGAQEIEGSAFDIDGGDISSATISGGLTWSAAQNLNNQTLTNVDINSGSIGPFTLTGKLTGGAQEIEGSAFDIDGGDISAVIVSGGLGWNAAQDMNNQSLINVDINSGNIGPFTLTGKLTGGVQEIEGSDFDIDGGDISSATISGGLNWNAAQDMNNRALTNVNIDNGSIGPFTLTGKITSGFQEIEGSNFDFNDGDINAATISGGLTWSAAQDMDNQNLTNVDINSGNVDADTVKVNSELFLSGRVVLENSSFSMTSNTITLDADAGMFVYVETQGGVALDTLVSVFGGVTGQIIIISSSINSRDVFIEDGYGNIILTGNVDFLLSDTDDKVMLIYDGTNWLSVAPPSNNG